MDQLEFEILETLYNSEYHELNEAVLMNKFLKDLLQAQRIVYDMLDEDDPLISRSTGKCAYKLTKLGIKTFKSEKQRRDQEAKQEACERKQKYFSRTIAVCSLIIGITGIVFEFIKFFE